jgi:hypothetical protein
MSSDIPPDRRELRFSQPFSAFLSDDSVRIFVPETCAVGAVLCLIAWVAVSWMGLISA